MNRRDFIRASALAGGGLMLAFQATAQLDNTAASEEMLGDFIRITPNGDILFQFVKHEMGQGVSTAMAQIIAEELGADWQRVKIDFPLANMARYQNDRNGGHDTGGSCTIIYQWDLLRKAGATARQMLVTAAARQWKTTEANCIAENNFVTWKGTSRKLSYGELATAAANIPVPIDIPLKESCSYQIIGKPKNAKLVPDIVTGTIQYGLDVQLPGMLIALIARCPVFKGKLKSYDATQALKVPGVKKVFTTQPIAGLQTDAPYMPHDIREGVVVVADTFWAARKGKEALEIEWDEGPNAKYSTEDFEHLAERRAMHRTDPTGYIGDENAVSNLTHVRKTLRASYIYPHQLHACMEPLNCTVHMQPDGCEVWMGSQAPNLIVSELKRIYHFPEEKIKVHLFPSGGGFGRRYYPDMAVEAAFISKEAGNVPVKMIWTREDDHQANLAHLFQYMEYQVALDKDSNLYAWYEKEIRTYTWAAKYADPQLPSMAYDIPNIRFDFEDMIADELVHSSAWRGVVSHGRCYSECFLDEIAAELKKDPYEFRVSLLRHGRDIYTGDQYPVSAKRLLGVLTLAAEKAGWGKPLEAGRGRGIAICPYGNSYCAAIAEVTVRDQKLTIDRITLAADCGNVINPSGAANQLAGGVVWSLTALLYGGLPIRNGRAIYTNFHQNKLLRMNECPKIDVHFVDSDDEKPWGVGEISTPLGVPSVLNAIYAATRKRIRKIPLAANAFQV
ncbi:MAG TPA: molybdopterin cofactor-binding domain-containing protein [Ohtaekwangia sp.]|uniref:xanthine dehydrogenase family protein molybdopterin-binding subunit n=1 Tax=Ohtaekwangia sp. TaxID=2066019 RepID=UPI002F95E537